MNNEALLNHITNYYLQSSDFNGCPSYSIPSLSIDDLILLIEDGKVFILSETDDINIFINRRNFYQDKSIQVQAVRNQQNFTIYPTPDYLATLNISEEKPFTAMLARGAEQFRIMYFAVDILEVYVNNPLYIILDHGYIGNVCVADSNNDDKLHAEYIKDFGISYPRVPPHDRDRAIAVFLRDLSKLNYEAQCKWRGFLLPDQNEFCVNYGFIQNLLLGEWTKGYWIFDALLDEMKVINAMCSSIGLPNLFRHEYSRENHDLHGYRILLLPSLKNYYEFVSALEKIIVNNLNYDTFQKTAPCIHPIERKKEDGSLKGSIEMLEEWFSVNCFASNPTGYAKIKEGIISCFRDIRKIRQVPAHELYINNHDKTLYKRQNDLICAAFHAVRELRMMFGEHPLAKTVVIPKAIVDVNNVVLY